MPAPHHSIFNFFTGQMLFLIPNQQRQSNEGKKYAANAAKYITFELQQNIHSNCQRYISYAHLDMSHYII